MSEYAGRVLHLFATNNDVARGYQRAGFYVVGVHPHDQPGYRGDEFHQADVRLAKFWATFPGPFDVIHASFPEPSEPGLVAGLRIALGLTGAIYVIENDGGLESSVALLTAHGSPLSARNLGRQIRAHLDVHDRETSDATA